MKFISFWVTFLVIAMMGTSAWGQVTGDYQSAATGNWNADTTWARFDGVNFVTPATPPTDADGVITILNTPHTVTVTANVTADQVVVQSGGRININSGVTLTIANGTGTDLDVSGTLGNTGTVTPTGTITFQSSGVYEHLQTAGTVPAATWNTGSTASFIGPATNATAPGGLGQSFQNVTWNYTGASSKVLAGALTTINGNLTINSISGTTLSLATTTSLTLNIGGNLVLAHPSGTVSLGSTGSPTVNITGGFTQSGAGSLSITGNGTGTVNVSGAFSQTAGTLTMSGGTGTGTMNVSGAFSQTAGTITETSTGSGTITFNGAGAQAVSSTGTISQTINFTINKSGGNVILPAPLTLNVLGTLTLTARNIITTATNLLTLGPSTSVSGGSTSSFVNGPMAHTIDVAVSTSKIFPIGKGSAFRPVTLTVTQVAAPTVYTAEVFNAAPTARTLPGSIDRVSTVRHWMVTKGAGAVVTLASITINYDSDDGVSDPADLRIVQDDGPGDGSGTAWLDRGGTGSGAPSGNITSTTNFTSFGDFTLGNNTGGDNPLPVELASFTAKVSEGKVVLRWATASESQNLGFNVYRSTSPDGPFIKLNPQVIPGLGTSGTGQEYRWVDDSVDASADTYYYYLKDVSLSGIENLSSLLKVNLNRLLTSPKESALLQNYPNSFNPETWMPFQLNEAANVTLNIYDVSGKLVRTLELGQKLPGYYLDKSSAAYWDGRNSNGERMGSGVYFYSLRAGDFTAVRRMVLQK